MQSSWIHRAMGCFLVSTIRFGVICSTAHKNLGISTGSLWRFRMNNSQTYVQELDQKKHAINLFKRSPKSFFQSLVCTSERILQKSQYARLELFWLLWLNNPLKTNMIAQGKNFQSDRCIFKCRSVDVFVVECTFFCELAKFKEKLSSVKHSLHHRTFGNTKNSNIRTRIRFGMSTQNHPINWE